MKRIEGKSKNDFYLRNGHLVRRVQKNWRVVVYVGRAHNYRYGPLFVRRLHHARDLENTHDFYILTACEVSDRTCTT